MKTHISFNLAAVPKILFLAMLWCDPVEAAGAKPLEPSPSSSETAVRAIRQEVQKIEQEAPKFRRVAKPWMDKSTEGGDVVGHFQGQSLRKAVEDLFGETGRSITEFYFQSNQPIFVVRTKIVYKRPFYSDEKTRNLEIAARTQERCYFMQGRLVNSLDSTGKSQALKSERVQSFAKSLLKDAREVEIVLTKTKAKKPGEEEPYPLDKKVDALLAHSKCTADDTFGACMATQLWDDELNRVYAELCRRLGPGETSDLKDVQRKWIAWRDAEFKVTDSFYGRQHGTMYQSFCEHHKKEIVRSRVMDLQHWLDLQDQYLTEKADIEQPVKGIDPN